MAGHTAGSGVGVAEGLGVMVGLWVGAGRVRVSVTDGVGDETVSDNVLAGGAGVMVDVQAEMNNRVEIIRILKTYRKESKYFMSHRFIRDSAGYFTPPL